MTYSVVSLPVSARWLPVGKHQCRQSKKSLLNKVASYFSLGLLIMHGQIFMIKTNSHIHISAKTWPFPSRHMQKFRTCLFRIAQIILHVQVRNHSENWQPHLTKTVKSFFRSLKMYICCYLSSWKHNYKLIFCKKKIDLEAFYFKSHIC